MEENVVMEIILNSGDARSTAMEAIRFASEGNFAEAEKYLENANEKLITAHKIQYEMIKDEANGKTHKIGLLEMHALDHFMNAITVLDLAKENIKLWKYILAK